MYLHYDNNKKYDPTNVLINSNDSDISNLSNDIKYWITTMPSSNIEATATSIAIVNQTRVNNTNILDKLYISYIGSKSTWVVKHYKYMTIISNKLKKVHTNL